ncbi:DNA dC-_dU-editing enzyme APOBEC-3F-like [Myotis yumanensis]|uniref:DNA dC->dU-editing enzyme APOBEC-3F-like n=1 Tax=Myotis yumanensis TaxID=159337 RepID=UPI0038D0C04F
MQQQQGNQDFTPVPWPRMYPKTFNSNFKNLAGYGCKSTFLCFEVERWEDGSVLDYQNGVFRNQLDPGHAELCFIEWFHEKVLFPDEVRCPDAQYHVTWYISWSPCFECAEQVAGFLNEHENVDLSISAARLYLCEDEDEQGLQDLVAAGAKVAMMAPEDFEYCWDNFVYNGGRDFTYWKNVRRNYGRLQEKLDEILWYEFPLARPLTSQDLHLSLGLSAPSEGGKFVYTGTFLKPGPVSRSAAPAPGPRAMQQQQGNQDFTPVPWPRMYPKTFNSNFKNLAGYGCKSTFLCFEVERWEDGSVLDYQNGVFRNQLDPGHAELCFIEWFHEKVLFPDEVRCPDAQYHVTWYISWSPCFECAEQVAGFLNEHENVDLSISAARLYLCEDEDKQGLQDLVAAGAKVAMMAPEDFEYCWDNFVYNGGRDFTYWKNVRRNYGRLQEKLDEILWD